MEQREQTPNRDGAEEPPLVVDDGDVRIVSFHSP
jgi:hypothetical protein